MKQNCWEIKQCGRGPKGKLVDELGICNAAIDRRCDGINGGINSGRMCWAIAGTLCNSTVHGSFAQKLGSCLGCSVFKQIKDEEGSNFIMFLHDDEELDTTRIATDIDTNCLLSKENIRT